MHNFDEITAKPLHKSGKLLFARADVWNDLRQLHRISGGGRARIEQNISLYRVK